MQSVAIITADPAVPKDLIEIWQRQRLAPAFTIVSDDVWLTSSKAQNAASEVELAIVSCARTEKLRGILTACNESAKATVCLFDKAHFGPGLRNAFPTVVFLEASSISMEALVVLAEEILKRLDWVARARRIESASESGQRHAALGKFMLESRHSFNNALTSVLGNAELMMLDFDTLPEALKEQVDTIHTMALRLHEMMQRFASIESEMSFTEKRSQAETGSRVQAYASGF